MSVAVITDIFDGVIARNRNLASQTLRLWDSNVDQIYWLITLGFIFVYRKSFFLEHWIAIGGILLLELIAYVICFGRFRKMVATHSILAKIFTLSLFIFLCELMWYGSSKWLFYICLILGFISRLEIILIVSFLKEWKTDVSGIVELIKPKRID